MRSSLFFCLPGIVYTGRCIRVAVLEPGKNAMTAGNSIVAALVKKNIMLTKVLAIFTSRVKHRITL